METTDWDCYGTGNYEKCADCMVHSRLRGDRGDRCGQPSAEGAGAWRCAASRTEGEMAPEIAIDKQRPAEYVFSRHVEEAMARVDEAAE